jgi:RNA polymerase sigma-70 factor, ECF subfamily
MNRDADDTVREFQQLIEPLLRQSAAYAYAIVRHRQDAEDALQEAAIKSFRALASYDPSRSFKAWWLAILRNCCRDLLRRRPSTAPLDAAECAPVARQNGDSADRDDLHAALNRLSQTHREILELRYFGGCTYREIAGVLDIPEGTVMSRLHAARQALLGIYKERISP